MGIEIRKLLRVRELLAKFNGNIRVVVSFADSCSQHPATIIYKGRKYDIPKTIQGCYVVDWEYICESSEDTQKYRDTEYEFMYSDRLSVFISKEQFNG